jgi:hypothetical protein
MDTNNKLINTFAEKAVAAVAALTGKEFFRTDDTVNLGAAVGAIRAEATKPEWQQSGHIRTFFDLSTAHVSPAARRWLEGNGFMIASDGQGEHPTATTRDGWFVYAPDFFNDRDRAPGSLHSDLFDAAWLARQHGCAYLLFDCDAPVVDGLPTYEDDDASTDGMTDQERAAVDLISNPRAIYHGEPEDAGLADELAEPDALNEVAEAVKRGERPEYIPADVLSLNVNNMTFVHPEDMMPLDAYDIAYGGKIEDYLEAEGNVFHVGGAPILTGTGVTALLERAGVDRGLIVLIAGRLSAGAKANLDLRRLKQALKELADG